MVHVCTGCFIKRDVGIFSRLASLAMSYKPTRAIIAFGRSMASTRSFPPLPSCWETRQSGLMGQQIGDRYVRFPVGRELWPIARNWSIWVQQATLDQHMCTRCRHTLATRHEDADRVGGVRSIIHLIAPCPEIHHPFPVTIDAELRTTFILQLRFGKGVAYRLEAIFYNSIYFSHVNSSLSVSQDLFSLTPLQVQSFHSLPSGRKRS